MTKLFLAILSLPVPILLVIAGLSEAELPGLGSFFIPLVLITLLIIVNGFFVMAEFALMGVRPSHMEYLANEGHRLAKIVLPVMRTPERQNHYFATAQLGITLASLGLGMYGEPQLSQFIEPYLAALVGMSPHDTLITSIGSIVAVSLLTYLHIVCGEMLPKSIALTMPKRAMFAVTHPMRWLQVVFSMPVFLLNGIGTLLLRLFRVPPAESHARLHSPEEIELIVSDSVEGGLLSDDEMRIIRNIFDFGDRQVHQVMTPRPRIEAIADKMPLPELLSQIAQSGHSRFPVYKGDLDNIIGVLHIKDLVRYQLKMKNQLDLRLLLRPMPVVPEHYPVEKLLVTLKRQRIHMALVLDEFGGTAGIVTLEDLVEEVVGEVRDEFDQEIEPIIQLAPGLIEVAGDYLIDDLKTLIDLGPEKDLPDVETVGGLLMTELGEIPKIGDQIRYDDNIRITVLAIDGLTITRAQIEYPAPSSA